MNLAQQKIKQAVENCNPEEFSFREQLFCGEEAVLVNPALQGTKWTQENKYLRSVIYRKSDYKILSASFPKFCNAFENPENFPMPSDILDARILDKIDGSTYIVDYINGEVNIRTRGTFHFSTLGNAKDFEIAFKKYPLIEPWIKNHPNITLIFEIVTPNQKIVLDYPEVDLFLIGANNKETLKLENQFVLDTMAMNMCVPRPKQYHFSTLNELLTTIREMKGIEGCVMYKYLYDPIKIKSEEYLKLHAFKSNATPKNILNLYFELNQPKFDEFKKYIIDNFDWECWQMTEDIVEKVCVAQKVVDMDIKDVNVFVKKNDKLSDKEFAFAVADKPWKSIAFSIRKGKEVSDKMIRKMIEQNL